MQTLHAITEDLERSPQHDVQLEETSRGTFQPEPAWLGDTFRKTVVIRAPEQSFRCIFLVSLYIHPRPMWLNNSKDVCFLQKMHPSALKERTHLPKRKGEELPGTSRKKACVDDNVPQACGSGVRPTGLVTQARLDTLIIDFVIEDMQSFSVVEQPAFVRLIHSLQPTKKVINRKAAVVAVEKRFENMMSKLVTELEAVKYLCTTADIWTAHNRGFFGTTVHWIEASTLCRRSAELGCSRFRGRHTYDAIASTLEQVHVKFGIAGKVVVTITDNGSNFLKAFRLFGTSPADTEASVQDEADSGESGEGDNSENDVEFTDMQAVMDISNTSAELEYSLPPHRSCASHTLNLVATHDAKMATEDQSYKKLYYSTMAKCSALWNKVTRSVQAAEIVHDELGMSLIVPNETRWNSQYDAVDKIRTIATTSESKLRAVFEKLSMAAFRPNELTFVSEFCAVMKPVATALDILQADKNCYVGFLLPTLISVRSKLQNVQGGVKFTVPLVRAVLRGIEKRFGHCFDDNELVLAACTLPQFRLRWCGDDETRERARGLLKRELSRAAHSCVTDDTLTQQDEQSDDADEEFFSFDNSTPTQHSVDQELELYLSDDSKHLDCLQKFPLVKELFLKFNTGLPSSAPVERLFSAGGQIMTPRRSRLNDEHFEMLLLLKSNSSFK